MKKITTIWMIAAALFELLPDKDKTLEKLRSAGIPGVELKFEKTVKYGIEGTNFSVFVHGTEEGAEDDHSHDHEYPPAAAAHKYCDVDRAGSHPDLALDLYHG